MLYKMTHYHTWAGLDWCTQGCTQGTFSMPRTHADSPTCKIIEYYYRANLHEKDAYLMEHTRCFLEGSLCLSRLSLQESKIPGEIFSSSLSFLTPKSSFGGQSIESVVRFLDISRCFVELSKIENILCTRPSTRLTFCRRWSVFSRTARHFINRTSNVSNVFFSCSGILPVFSSAGFCK